MFSRSSHPKPWTPRRSLACAAGLSTVALGLPASPALAARSWVPPAEPAPATCEGQLFSQPFAAFEDLRYYTLVPGGEFNSASEGWTLSGGAQIVTATRPEGSTGGVLYLPTGAVAISPPLCVTLAYPIARTWVNAASGTKRATVSVSYANTRTATEPLEVGKLRSRHGTWTLGEFNVEPQAGGEEEAPRNVRFIIEASKTNSNTELYDLYVDPRMR
jgi:hypothetical protein